MNDPLDSIREKQLVIQATNAAYLDQLVGHSVGQPVVSQPLVSLPVAAPVVSQPSVGWSSVDQPGHPIPPLLSLQLWPDLNALTWTLSPQALWYVHLSIQISKPIKLNYNGINT